MPRLPCTPHHINAVYSFSIFFLIPSTSITVSKMKSFLFLLWLICTAGIAHADKVSMDAIRSLTAPRIDGDLNDACWQNIPAASNFITLSPEYGKPESQKTEVRVTYDDQAIYIGAYMYDNQPSLIKRQLSQRDATDALADNFIVGFDTYDDGLNGYRFLVTAAGVQLDEKGSPSNAHDVSWDAVWQSAVDIKSDGWVCEMKIPYSAIRFPSKPLQDWGMQFGRNITREGELDLWSPVDPKVAGIINQWGKLKGLENIKPPLRLSFSPYFTAGYQVTPVNYDPAEYASNKLLSGGMDVKYGVNESFTLDATLIPDFGQVQSDNVVLNISPFETKFDEKRPFFTEGTELFNQDNRGNTSQLFYSRRIGGTPLHYYDAGNDVQEGETLIRNPSETKLYNATKFSGRNNHGLGIGILNAVTRVTYAEIKNEETGEVRTVETNPLSNYSVIVFDQTLKNNSKISFENTNVMRSGSAPDANVGSIHYDIRNKANSLEAVGFGNLSMVFNEGSKPATGGYYQVSLNQTKGKFNPWFWHELITDEYDQNDLGILYYNNQMTNGAGFNYNNQELKKGPFYNISGWYSLNYKTLVKPLVYEEWETNGGMYVTFKNFWSGGVSLYSKPFWYYDYYEPRVEGRKFYHNPFAYSSAWINSDYRKNISVSVSAGYGDAPGAGNPFFDGSIAPTITVNDHFSIGYELYLSSDHGTESFVDIDADDDIIFGTRNTATVSNNLRLRYTFNPKMNISFRARYYWSKVNWTEYYLLNEDGTLGDTEYSGNNDINFNAFNIDAVYAWEFAPGSYLNVIWKNNIQQYDDLGMDTYFDNVGKTFQTPQTNGLSIKLIYYLDYLALRKKTS